MKLTADRIAQEEKCVETARKWVLSQKKSGKWLALVNLVMAIAFIGASIMCGVVVVRLGPALQGPQIQNAQWFGFAIGMFIGFWSGVLAFKGGMLIVHGIKFLRGDLAAQLLVDYHDCLVALLKERESSRPGEKTGRNE